MWTETGVAEGNDLRVGDLGLFRYVDADAYDVEGWEIFFGPVIQIEVDPVDGVASIQVLCQDGALRHFANFEVWVQETLDEYEARIREGRPLNFYED